MGSARQRWDVHGRVVAIAEAQDNAQPGAKRKREQDDAARAAACDSFELDNDVEECSPELVRSCRNCLYRYWTEDGFACTKVSYTLN